MFDVTGQVNISSAHTVTLDFMIIDYDTDPPSIIIMDLNAPDNQNYMILLDGGTGEGTLFANGQTFMGAVTFTYNNGTLTITQATLTDIASDATVAISGSLSYIVTNIPANTPTVMQFTNFDDENDFVILYSMLQN